MFCSLLLADETSYVDIDVAGGDGNGKDWANAYATAAAWDAAEANDLVVATKIDTVYFRASSGSNDTTQCTIGQDWDTDTDYYIHWIGDDFPADGIYDATAYILEGQATTALQIEQDAVILENMQFVLSGATSNDWCVKLDSSAGFDGGGTVQINECIVMGIGLTGGGTGVGVFSGEADAILVVRNTQILDFNSVDTPGDTGFYGIRIDNGVASFYNCIMEGNVRACYRIGGTLNVYNSASFHNHDDWGGTITGDYCCSDDNNMGSGANHIDWDDTATDWDANFTDYANNDYTVKDVAADIYLGSELTQADDALIPDDDIIGTARDTGAGEQTSIGCYEFVSAGGVVPTPYYYRGLLVIPIIPFGLYFWRRKCAA